MSSKKQSPRQSQNSSPAPQQQQAPTRSLIASKVSFNEDPAKVLNDLSHNYIGVEKISQMHDKDGNPIGAIRIDFTSEKTTMEILNKGYILIDGKQRPVRAYRTLICRRCDGEGHRASECPQKPLSEQRLMEIFKQQQT
jgi:hypothetical protein